MSEIKICDRCDKPIDSRRELSLHIDMSEFDSDRIKGAYPTLLVDQITSEFDRQTNEYIAKKLIYLDIDKDILFKQAEELKRLNNDTQKLCDKAYQQGRKDVEEDIKQILTEYFEGTDSLGGSDETYVIARIAGLVGFDYDNCKIKEQTE